MSREKQNKALKEAKTLQRLAMMQEHTAVVQSSANWMVGGFISGFLGPHVKASLGKTLTTMLLTDVSIGV